MKTIKAKNGKSYTKKQICEAIEYWKKQLKRLDEDIQNKWLYNEYLLDAEPSVDSYDTKKQVDPKFQKYLKSQIFPNAYFQDFDEEHDFYMQGMNVIFDTKDEAINYALSRNDDWHYLFVEQNPMLDDCEDEEERKELIDAFNRQYIENQQTIKSKGKGYYSPDEYFDDSWSCYIKKI